MVPEKGAGNPFKISHIEEKIDNLEKRMLANQNDDTTREILTKKRHLYGLSIEPRNVLGYRSRG